MNHDRHEHDRHEHDRHEHDRHEHDHDQGWRGALRYLRLVRRMWVSPVSDAVVDLVAPQPGELVVDLGAGMGPGAARAAAAGAQVLAVDPTPFMRRMLGVRRRVDRRARRVSVLDGAAESMPLADHCVDALWSVNTMHHWSDRSLAAAEFARVMAPGGRIVLVDEDFTDPAHPSHEAHARRASHHHFDHATPDTMTAALTGAGLVVDQAERSTITGRPALVVRAHAQSTE